MKDGEELFGVGVWKRLEKNSVDDTEDCGVGADAEGEREDRDRGEAGIFAQHAEGETKILKRGFDEGKAAEFAICFFELGIAAKADARGASGFFGGHAAADVFLRRHFEMRVEFVLEFAIDDLRRSLRAEARDDGFQKGEHDVSSFRRCEERGRLRRRCGASFAFRREAACGRIW